MKKQSFPSSHVTAKLLDGEKKEVTFFSSQANQEEISKKALYNSTFLPSSSSVSSKSLPPSTKQWSNSIYSFNNNYTKTLPSVDILVGKLIKGFFSINPLANNPDGKKSRLVVRRFKRLSLNRIFVSKPEIKHSNNKVFITVYLFNKKKRSLLSKLKNLYEKISYKDKTVQELTRNSSKQKKAFSHEKRNKPSFFSSLSKPRSITKSLLHKMKFANSKPLNYKNKGKNHSPKGHSNKNNNYDTKMINKRNKTSFFSKLSQARLYKDHKNIIGKSNSLYILKKKPVLKSNKRTLSLSKRSRSRKLYIKLRSVKAFSFVALARKRGNLSPMALQMLLFKKKLVNYKIFHLSLLRKIQSFSSKFILSLTCNQIAKTTENISRDESSLGLSKNSLVSQSSFSASLSGKILLKKYYYTLNKYKLYNNFALGSNAIGNRFLLSLDHKIRTQPDFSFNTLSTDLHSTSTNLEQSKLEIVNKDSIQKNPRFSLALHKPSKFHNLLGENLKTPVVKKGLSSHLFSKHKRGKVNATMHKVKALYKLFTFYNNTSYYNKTAEVFVTKNKSNILPVLSLSSSKIWLNTYKLLKKSGFLSRETLDFIPSSVIKNPGKENSPVLKKRNKNNVNIITTSYNPYSSLKLRAGVKSPSRTRLIKSKKFFTRPITSFLYLYNENKLNKKRERIVWLRKIRKTRLEQKHMPVRIKNLSTPSQSGLEHRTIRAINSIIVMKRLNKINSFFTKYKNLNEKPDIDTQNPEELGLNITDKALISYDKNHNNNSVTRNDITSVDNIANFYKLNYLKEILDKELLYIYSLKTLVFNNNIFKNWFLHSLKNLLSKVYNKKVILNLINLKYIHLNSDIFTQAIAIRLRNFKKNRLNKVLRKALKLIVLSKINIYSYDIHSPVNKFLDLYYNKFKHLNKDIFKEFSNYNNVLEKTPLSRANPFGLNKKYGLKPIKGLKYKGYAQQSNQINFIRHKSVFGVRLEAGGRLTKRSTASRAIFKIRYRGNLRNNITLNRKDTSTLIGNNRISNLQYTKICSKTRNGSFGLKGWLNNN